MEQKETSKGALSARPPSHQLTARIGCYNCMKRRVICDKTSPKCKKCAKRALDCPGYGIRYRFAKPQHIKDTSRRKTSQPKATASLVSHVSEQTEENPPGEEEAVFHGNTNETIAWEDLGAELDRGDQVSKQTVIVSDPLEFVDPKLLELSNTEIAQLDGSGSSDCDEGQISVVDLVKVSPLLPSLESLDAQTRLLFSHCE